MVPLEQGVHDAMGNRGGEDEAEVLAVRKRVLGAEHTVCVCVCMHACVRVCMCVCACVRAWVCTANPLARLPAALSLSTRTCVGVYLEPSCSGQGR